MIPSIEAPAAPPVRRHHGLVRLTHWLNAVLLVGIGSGLQIYGAYTHFGLRGDPFRSRIHGTARAFRRGHDSAAGSRAG